MVGYNTVQYKAGKWMICATPFESVKSTPMNLQDLVTGFAGTDVEWVDAATARTTAPYIQIQVRDANGDVTGAVTEYFYVNNAKVSLDGFVPGVGPTYTTKAGWCNTSGNYIGGSLESTEVTVAPGTAFWFKDPTADADLIVAGKVVTTDASTVEPTVGKWNLVCNPFPMEVALNSDSFVLSDASDVAWTDAATAREAAPYIQIQVRDANGDVTGAVTEYFYVNNAKVSLDGFVPGVGPTYTTKAGWCDTTGNYVGGSLASTTVKIPAGSGFWFKDPTSAATIRFVK